jgi:NADPH:quinone reductase-like Zn-dependent oxidoreductase
MKAIVLHEYGPPENLKYEDFEDPKPGPGEVLVRVAAVSINPVDWKMRSGEAKARFPLEFPAIIGRDLSGVVREVGEGVTGFEPGDKVFALANHTYAELCVVKASELAKIPDGIELVHAAALPLVTLTGEQLIRIGTGIRSGQTILITGALGGVGRSAVRVAKDAGAKVIAGVRAKQLKEAESLGADHVLALDDEKAIEKLGLIDAVADTINHETAEKLIGKVTPGGIFASVLGPPANAALHPQVKVVPVMCKPDPERMVKLAEDVKKKRLTIPIDRMIPLADAGQGHRVAEKGGIGKVILTA